ncbi:glycosyltransferase family 2 protein [Uliginosibacterium sp. TH139]|uniref:glycosyltransferase family 2 protein n=1 Tax=Uliginosibacterium sp. TH139 TaxID=2067453 RepID=UPI000C7BA2FA|nr:glycosyl transferase family 2 [Uliginosibacterium sp. TH139]PLK50693.1 glycosyl transferase family 2 [Uliginosibacterium sp. TH139]
MIQNPLPQAFVIVATKGRPVETANLLGYIAAQSYLPLRTLVVGADAADVAGLGSHPLVHGGQAEVLVCGRAGLTLQRNAGLDRLAALVDELKPADWFVAFFDDDFRPASNWLVSCAQRFAQSAEVVGLCGNLLADGIHSSGYDEQTARDYLLGKRAPESHWAHGKQLTELVDGLYGCNMAYRGPIAIAQRFDEKLPLYGWQEDIDFAGRARRYGKLVCEPACRGVHMGVQGARTSGLRFGYSQIANPVYLIRKGSMRTSFGARLAARNLASNLFNSLRLNRRKDYAGRLRGNFQALVDAGLGRLHPERVLSIR